jgi:hypothetical protein
LKCYGYPETEGEGCGAGESLACYPLNGGGYLVTFESSFCGPGCADEYQFWTKKYIDGKLTGIRSLESGDSRNNTIDWTRSDLQIYDLQGRKIPTDSRLLTPESLPSGLYLIKQGTNVIKYNKK